MLGIGIQILPLRYDRIFETRQACQRKIYLGVKPRPLKKTDISHVQFDMFPLRSISTKCLKPKSDETTLQSTLDCI